MRWVAADDRVPTCNKCLWTENARNRTWATRVAHQRSNQWATRSKCAEFHLCIKKGDPYHMSICLRNLWYGWMLPTILLKSILFWKGPIFWIISHMKPFDNTGNEHTDALKVNNKCCRKGRIKMWVRTELKASIWFF